MKGLYIFDSETDGLAGKSISRDNHMSKFHCLLFKEYKKDNWNLFLDKSHPEYEEAKDFAEAKGCNLSLRDLNEFNDWIEEEPIAIGCQNLEGFDMLAFEFSLGTKYTKLPEETINGKPIRVYDTLSMSRHLFPDRPLPHGCPSKIKCPDGGKAKTIGPHSLEAWGYKVANKKVAIEDWKGLPLWKYVDRVWEDVIINELQWQALVKEMLDGKDKGVEWAVPLKRGLQSDHLMVLQEQQGVVFNEKLAWELLERVDKLMVEIEEDVEPKLPLKDVPPSRQPTFPKEPFDKNGNISHWGWKYAENVLGFELNQEYFTHTSPPKTAFKKDGTLSVAGRNYCLKNEVEDESVMGDYIREQSSKGEVLVPVSPEKEIELRELLEAKHIPEEFLKEKMTLSNQEDIKEWLVVKGGWVPTLFNTKNVTIDAFKKKLPDYEIEDSCWEYIQDKKDSVYQRFISMEMGIDLTKIKSRSDKGFNAVFKKGRFLVTSPKFKDERGELCRNLDLAKGEMAKQIIKWLSARNRRSVIKSKDETKTTGWLNHPRLKLDGKLPARYSGLTPTFRRKHNIIANIPSTDAFLGYEMRSLFTVPKGYWQIGVDGSNLEGMVAAEAAYPFDGGAYYRSLSGDPHTTNALAYSKAAGVEVSRGGGKPITYGVLYGAQAAKVAAMLGIPVNKGQDVIDAYWSTNYGLKACKEHLEAFWKSTGKKYILGFDKRKIYIRSQHSLLNSYLQSGGAIGMDLAGILWHEACVKEGLLEKGVARTIYYHKQYCGFTQ